MKTKISLLILMLTLSFGTSFSQSDGCSGATSLPVTLNCTTPTAGTTTGATQTISGCVGTADDDVWYTFTATATSHVITVVPSASLDPVVQLFSGSCSSLISLNCMDNGLTGETETISASGLTIGVIYTIRIYHYYAGSGSGTFTICVTQAPTPPSNDNCVNATLLNVNSSCSYTNATSVSATQSQAGCAGTADDDVWFKFIATNSVQTITVDPSSTMDPVVELFSGSCASLIQVTCMDAGFTDGNEIISAVGLIPGNTYYIRVYDYYSGTGGSPFQICITGTPTAAPTNDEPCSAIQLPAVTSACNFMNFTTVGATTSAGAPVPSACAGGSAPQQGGFNNTPQPKDVWFKITVPSSGIITITTQPGYGISDGVMALYSGTCASLTQIACSDDYNYPGAANDFKPFILASGLTSGSTVYLRYWAFNGNTTNVFGICVSTPTNDNCANNLYICDLNNYSGTTSAAYSTDRPCNMRGNAETNNPPTYTYTPGTCQGGVFGLGGAWGTGAPNCDVKIDNNSWIQFTASNTTATLTVNINNCFVGNYPSGGIQMQIFSAGSPCCNYTPVSDFKEGSSQLTITANNLTIGNNYYLMIDGFAGDICSYSLTATAGVQFPDITTTSTSICAGQTITLNGPAGASAYDWSPGGQTTQNITVTPAYSQTYSLEVTGVCGYRQTLSIPITVNNFPIATSTSNSPLCIGQTINLSSGGGATYSWSGPNGFTSTLQNPTRSSATALMAGTYYVTVTSSAGCSSTSSTPVTINTLPAATASNTGPFCQGTTISLSSSGGTSYSWSGPSGWTSTLQNPTRTNATTAMSGTYNVTVTNSNGCTATNSTVVTVNTSPSATAGNTGAFCVGNSISLNSSGGTNYSWSGPNGFTSSVQNPTIAGATTTMAGTYYVTVTNSSSCTSIASTSVSVNTNPVATASNSGPYCAGATISLNSSGGTSYNWSGPSTFSSTVQNPIRPTSTTAMSGTYTVTVTGANNCTSVTTTSVIINNNPVPNAGSDVSIPNGTSTTLNGSASGGSGNYSYSWSPTSSLVNPNLQNPQTVNLTVTTIYTVTITDNTTTCTSTDQVTVVVTGSILSTNPSASPSTICSGNTTQLYANAGGGTGSYTYTWTSSPAGFSSNIANPTVSPTVTTTYFVSINDGSNTTSSSVTITVNPLPSLTLNSNSPVCEQNVINLTSTSGTTYQWSGPNGFTSTNQNPSISSVSLSNAGVYYATISNSFGCTTTSSTTVTINTIPVTTSASNSPVCEGNNINFSLSGGTSWSWTGPNSFTSSLQSPVITNSTPANSGTYTCIISNLQGCTNTENIAIVVNNGITANINSNSPVCEGNNINLTSSGSTSYIWSGPNGFNSTSQNPVISTSSISDAGTYYVTVSNIFGCTSTSTTNVIVNSIPAVTINSNSPVCEGNNLTITLTGGAVWNWTGPNSYTSTLQSPMITGVTLANSGTYTCLVTNSSGCTNNASVNIIINSNPLVNTNSNSPICEGNAINLTTISGTNYQWSGPNGFTSTLQNPSINTALLSDSGYYSVTVTNNSGCTSSASESITIFAIPLISIISNSPVCEGNNISITSSGGATYLWSGPNGFFSNTQNQTISNANNLNSGIYTVTATGANGCTTSATTTVSVQNLPIVSCTNTTPLCVGDPIELFSSGGTTYNWTGPDSFISTDQNPVILNASLLNSGIYNVTVTDNYNCTNIAQTSINYPTPLIITSNVEQYPSSKTGSITLTVSGGSGSYQYLWSNNATTSSISELQTGTYIVTITDNLLCQLIDTFTIDIPLIIPTLITPNGDNVNDDFEIIGIGAYPEVTIEIFNRWGDKLFLFDGTGEEYSIQTNRWNGKLKGKDLPLGSYVFIVNLHNDKDPINGVCSIVR
ncbi:MAG: gliding motility-associated C-terminal domain-containing protein [Bacteroidia bacterium]|nr:gliding motility-associated C-terminal domain-containing protein [Bacteroidia bacterium]